MSPRAPCTPTPGPLPTLGSARQRRATRRCSGDSGAELEPAPPAGFPVTTQTVSTACHIVSVPWRRRCTASMLQYTFSASSRAAGYACVRMIRIAHPRHDHPGGLPNFSDSDEPSVGCRTPRPSPARGLLEGQPRKLAGSGPAAPVIATEPTGNRGDCSRAAEQTLQRSQVQVERAALVSRRGPHGAAVRLACQPQSPPPALEEARVPRALECSIDASDSLDERRRRGPPRFPGPC